MFDTALLCPSVDCVRVIVQLFYNTQFMKIFV